MTLSACHAGAIESVTRQETGRPKRKQISKQNTSDALNGCLYGMVLESECNEVLKCKRVGCETQWVSIDFGQVNHYNSLMSNDLTAVPGSRPLLVFRV